MAKTNQKKQQTTSPKMSQSRIWLIGILVITALVFSGVKNGDFLTNWDDDGYIIQNTHIYKINAENIGKMFTSYYKSNYQPVSVFTYAIEFVIFGLKPHIYHITNLLFHLLNTALVFLFIEKLVKKTNVAAIAALLFGIHTMHVESVAWIAERKDVTYGAFYLLSMLAYLNYSEDTSSKKQLWISLVWYLLSCLSKSMAVTLPVILLAIDYYKGRKIDLKAIIEKAPFFILSLIFGIVALYSQSGQAMDIAPEFGFVNRIFIVCYAMVFYIFKLFLPTGLAAIQYYPPTNEPLPIAFYLAPLVILGLAFWIWKAKTFRKELVFGLGFFLISISLVLQIIPVGHAFASERYSYLPYTGLFFVIGMLYDKASSTQYKTVFNLALIAFSIMLSFMTYQRIKVWENSISLFSDTIEKYPKVAHAYWMRGNVYKEYKQNQLAIADYNKAIELDPEYAKAYFNRGGAYANMKQLEKSIEDYNKSIELDPSYSPAWNNRGNSYANLGQIEKAKEDYLSAIEVDSSFVVPYKSLGDLLVNTKQYNDALTYYDKAININSTYADAMHGKGIALYNLGKKQEACSEWQQAATIGMQASKDFLTKYCK